MILSRRDGVLIQAATAVIVGLMIAGAAISAPISTRFDMQGGIASPGPGLALGASGLVNISTAGGVGLASGLAMHDLATSDSKLMTRFHDAFYEQSIPLLGGFHFFRVRIGAGAVMVSESVAPALAAVKGVKVHKERWATHVAGAVALDLPVADLAWGRIGFWTEKALIAKLPWQGGMFVGVVLGGPWFGLGD
jgi:hypothetical protein